MPLFKALTPILHNGKSYQEGKTVELSEEEAEPLLETMAVSPAGMPPPEPEIPAEDPLVVTTQVSGRDPESVDVKKAPPSSARVAQQKGQ